MTSNNKASKAPDRNQELGQQVRELSTLYEVSKILTSALSLDKSLDLITKTAANMMEVKACGLRLLDKQTGEMVLKAVYGLSHEYISKGRVFVWKGLYRDVIIDKNVAVIEDVAADPRIEYTQEAVIEGIKSMLCVGLMLNDEPIGALSVYTAREHIFTTNQIRIFQSIANEAAVAIERAFLYEERMESQRTEQELDAASKIQMNLMPRENFEIGNYKIAAKNIPARIVGGDFYDFVPFDEEHLGITIADVSGKGIPGAILMASARASLRAYLEEPHGVEWVITKLNSVLCRDTRQDQFVSLFYGMLDVREESFTYVNAGHNPPVLFRNGKEILLEEGGVILGVLPDATYAVGKMELQEGDVILLYTDGITEAERDGEYFGVERLFELAKSNLSSAPNEINAEILSAVMNFSAGSPQTDDRTVIVLKEMK